MKHKSSSSERCLEIKRDQDGLPIYLAIRSLKAGGFPNRNYVSFSLDADNLRAIIGDLLGIDFDPATLQAPEPDPIEKCGDFVLRYGYNSSMTLLNVLGVLEKKGVSAYEATDVLHQMSAAGVPAEKLQNYLADYYKLFGW